MTRQLFRWFTASAPACDMRMSHFVSDFKTTLHRHHRSFLSTKQSISRSASSWNWPNAFLQQVLELQRSLSSGCGDIIQAALCLEFLESLFWVWEGVGCKVCSLKSPIVSRSKNTRNRYLHWSEKHTSYMYSCTPVSLWRSIGYPVNRVSAVLSC